jgi:hypothetical protein
MASNPTTLEAIALRNIGANTIATSDGTLRAIVQMSALNFDLRSDQEQQAILQQFQSFLNGLDFPVQIVVQSRAYDVNAYITSVKQVTAGITNNLLRTQADEYAKFVTELAQLANIMEKKFYVVLSLSAPAPKAGGGLFDTLTGIFKKKQPAPTTEPTPVNPQTELVSAQLSQRADAVIAGLSGIGLTGRLLGHEELVAVFADLYNPKVFDSKQSTA